MSKTHRVSEFVQQDGPDMVPPASAQIITWLTFDGDSGEAHPEATAVTRAPAAILGDTGDVACEVRDF